MEQDNGDNWRPAKKADVQVLGGIEEEDEGKGEFYQSLGTCGDF